MMTLVRAGSRLWGPALLMLAAACAPRNVGRYDREQLAASLAAAESDTEADFKDIVTSEGDGDGDGETGERRTPPGLLVGTFVLASHAVVDGDTIKVVGIEGTLRLLGIDTEETFKSDKDRRAYDEGLEAYLAKKQAGKDRPIKAATPLGMDAKHWAEEFFEGVREVRLERDHPKELRGRYGRLLAYVMVKKDGKWLNYNVECVRAGMSPYFSKYGYSRRFHDEFVEAQEQARKAGVGIWDPAREHYLDYDLRLRWWDARADVIARFEREAEDNDHYVTLTNWDSMQRLSDLEGEEVVILATVGEVRPREGKRPARVMLSRRMFSDLPLIFFDDEVLALSNVESARGEFVRVTGTVSRYVFRGRGKRGRSKKKRDERKKKRDERKNKAQGEAGQDEELDFVDLVGKAEEEEELPSQLQIRIRRPEQITFVDTRPGRLSQGFAPLMPASPSSEDEPASSEPAPSEPAPTPTSSPAPDSVTPSPTPDEDDPDPAPNEDSAASDPAPDPSDETASDPSPT